MPQAVTERDALASVFFYALLTGRIDAEAAPTFYMTVMAVLFAVVPAPAAVFVILALEASPLHGLGMDTIFVTFPS